MKIGIIGAGEIGGALTRRLTALGHQVSVANSRGPETLGDLATETGAKPVSVAEAARSGEVVVVTIPEKNIPNLPRDLFAATLDSVVVVDTGNYYPRQRDGRIEAIEAGTTESRGSPSS
jgi:predicted dinucleotide-binding enzyme